MSTQFNKTKKSDVTAFLNIVKGSESNTDSLMKDMEYYTELINSGKAQVKAVWDKDNKNEDT